MESLTTRVDNETREKIEELVDKRGSSISEVTRELIEKGLEYDSLRAKRDDLLRQLRETNRRVDEHQQLVEYVEEERSLQARREEYRREREQANILTRAKWLLVGRPTEETTET